MLFFGSPVARRFGAFAQDSSQPAATTAGPKHMGGDRAEHKLKKLSKRLTYRRSERENQADPPGPRETTEKPESDTPWTAQQKHEKRETSACLPNRRWPHLDPEQKEKIQSRKNTVKVTTGCTPAKRTPGPQTPAPATSSINQQDFSLRFGDLCDLCG